MRAAAVYAIWVGLAAMSAWWAGACDGGSDTDRTAVGGTSSAVGTGGSGGAAEPPAPGACGSVRLTQYVSSDTRWCGFDRTSSVLPDFVRQGMTIAIAEPYDGSSYEGEPGEACGECWEIDTIAATQVVMVHDLCPIDGNPVCAGSHFHFDVSGETADALGEPLGEASARRVPCPVTGNIHVRVAARNQYGYVQLAFFNHRLPVRSVEYRPADGASWTALERCDARWCGEDDAFADGGPGAVFRLTSAEASIDPVQSEPFPYSIGEDAIFDTGAQFAEVAVTGGSCVFVPPADVYDEGWGGIDGVRWEPNPWGSTSLSELGTDCADASESCVLLAGFGDSGLHVTYRTPFPTTTFASLSLQLRAQSGAGTVDIAPRSEEARCPNPTTVEVGAEWSSAQLDVAASCPGVELIHGLTISQASAPMDLVVDEIRFE